MNLDTVALVNHFEFIGARHSELVHHGECCQLARRWLVDMHRSLSFNRSEEHRLHAPTWLRQRFKWGPVQWPLSWCETVRKSQIDCGVFAALSREIFAQQGVDVYPAQVILNQPKTYVQHWNLKWANIFQTIPWIGQEYVYHEVCAVAEAGDSRIRIYDPTESVWLDSEFSRGLNGVVGLNVNSPVPLNWGTLTVGQGKWALI